jgi:hypothetical protein
VKAEEAEKPDADPAIKTATVTAKNFIFIEDAAVMKVQ